MIATKCPCGTPIPGNLAIDFILESEHGDAQCLRQLLCILCYREYAVCNNCAHYMRTQDLCICYPKAVSRSMDNADEGCGQWKQRELISPNAEMRRLLGMPPRAKDEHKP